MGISLLACDKKQELDQSELQDDSVVDLGEVDGVKMPSEVGDMIYIYSSNEEFGDRLQYFREKYPQYADRVVYINLELGATSEEYKNTLNELLKNGYEKEDRYPSIIVLDENIALDFIQSDYTMSIEELGIQGEELSQMFQYTLDFATYEDSVKALAWQTTPGVVCYRADIAEEVLGTSKPEEVHEAISSWDKFFETATKMKEAGYKIVSGPDDIKYPYFDLKESPCVDDEKLKFEQWVTDYLTDSKKLYDGDFTGKTVVESEAWMSNMDKDVFCYFGNPQFYYWGLNPVEHAGDYKICEGPSPFHWGGTYVAASKECPDKDLTALVLRTICCDKDTMAQICGDTNDFVNNKNVIQSMIDEEISNTDVYGGDSPFLVFKNVAEKIDLRNTTSYDGVFNYYVDQAATEYNAGKFEDIDSAKNWIKEKMFETYDYLKVEE